MCEAAMEKGERKGSGKGRKQPNAIREPTSTVTVGPESEVRNPKATRSSEGGTLSLLRFPTHGSSTPNRGDYTASQGVDYTGKEGKVLRKFNVALAKRRSPSGSSTALTTEMKQSSRLLGGDTSPLRENQVKAAFASYFLWHRNIRHIYRNKHVF